MQKNTINAFLQKCKNVCKKILHFCLNPRMLLCFGIAWFITNGWCYVFVGVGAYFGITWMTVIGSAWATILWFPFTPEKIITLIIAIFLLRLLFPNDQKTLLVLRTEQQKIRAKMHVISEKRRAKRRAKQLQKQLRTIQKRAKK